MIEDRHVDAGPTVGIDGLAKPVGVTPAAEVEAQLMPDSSGRPKGCKGETQLVDVAPAVETKGRHMNVVSSNRDQSSSRGHASSCQDYEPTRERA